MEVTTLVIYWYRWDIPSLSRKRFFQEAIHGHSCYYPLRNNQPKIQKVNIRFLKKRPHKDAPVDFRDLDNKAMFLLSPTV